MPNEALRPDQIAIRIFGFYPATTKAFVNGFTNRGISDNVISEFIPPKKLILSEKYVL